MPERWLELSVDAPPEYAEPLSEIFRRYGEGGVAIEQPGGFNPDEGESPPVPDAVTIKTYLPMDATTRDRRDRIGAGVRLMARLAAVSDLRERAVSEDDWRDSWKEFFHPLRIGGGIVICPTWRDCETLPGDTVIRLDPGMAFGTGHHPTTRMCLELLEREIAEGDRVLDLGCGSGVLSIAAAKLGAAGAVGFEIDAAAVRAARANVDMNGVGDRVETVHGTLPSAKAPPQGFDLALANISARVVTDMAANLADCIAPGGTLIASGVIEAHLDGVIAALDAAGATVRERAMDGDWAALVATV